MEKSEDEKPVMMMILIVRTDVLPAALLKMDGNVLENLQHAQLTVEMALFLAQKLVMIRMRILMMDVQAPVL